MIEGVIVTPLRRIEDERGAVIHMLRNTDPHFEQFGEIYFSHVYPSAIKAWHLHREMTLNYAVVIGAIKLVLFDDRVGSTSHGEIMEVFVSERNNCLVTIPKMVWNGFKGLGEVPAIVANCATHPHDPGEIVRISPRDAAISYDWDLKNG